MRQKMPHYFIRWFTCSQTCILFFTPQQVEHVRRHSKIRLSENLIFLPLYPCFHSTASGTHSQTFQTTSWSKLRKRSTTINAQFNELNEKSSISFSFYTRCIESERAQSSTCWTVYPSWNQKRGWCITIIAHHMVVQVLPPAGRRPPIQDPDHQEKPSPRKSSTWRRHRATGPSHGGRTHCGKQWWLFKLQNYFLKENQISE